MLPYIKVLKALALVSTVRPHGAQYAMDRAKYWHTAFPCPVEQVLSRSVFPALPAATEAYLLTTNVAITRLDVPTFLSAAASLNVADIVQFGTDGYPEVVLPGQTETWRRDQNLRIFIEVYLIGGLDIATLKIDLDKAWGNNFDPGELAQFATCFMDSEHLRGAAWQTYLSLLPTEEATFKLGLQQQPSDFIRWKMGTPVHLDAAHVLDRLVSDAYYTERQIKMEAGEGGIALTKSQQDRVKLERDTIFKGLDHRRKLIELEREGQGDNDGFDSSELLDRLEIKYDSDEDAPLRSMADLEIEHDSSELRTVDELNEQD